eukprot:scaffold31908_cov55-Cyclotella_meneghiniana.AAC.2
MRRSNPQSWTSHRNTRGASRVRSCDESTIKDYYNSSVDSRTGRDYKRDVMYVSSQGQRESNGLLQVVLNLWS